MGLKLTNFIFSQEEKKPSINSIAKNNYYIVINLDIPSYDNFEPDNIVNLFSLINKTKYEGEEIFILNKKYDDEIELLSPINLKTYFLKLNSELTKEISNLECFNFIYIKNYILEDDKNIRYDALTIFRKANDFDIFHLLESKFDFCPVNINNIDGIIQEINPFIHKEGRLIKINCLVSKVVLKDNKKQRLLIIDIFKPFIF